MLNDRETTKHTLPHLRFKDYIEGQLSGRSAWGMRNHTALLFKFNDCIGANTRRKRLGHAESLELPTTSSACSVVRKHVENVQATLNPTLQPRIFSVLFVVHSAKGVLESSVP